MYLNDEIKEAIKNGIFTWSHYINILHKHNAYDPIKKIQHLPLFVRTAVLSNSLRKSLRNPYIHRRFKEKILKVMPSQAKLYIKMNFVG